MLTKNGARILRSYRSYSSFQRKRRAVRGTGQRIVAARQAPPRFGGILLVEETQKGVLGVRYQNTVFGSLLKAVPRRRFAAIVERHGGGKEGEGCAFRGR